MKVYRKFSVIFLLRIKKIHENVATEIGQCTHAMSCEATQVWLR